MMYVIALDNQIVAKTNNKGVIFTNILSNGIIAFYVERFAKYDLFYGSISNICLVCSSKCFKIYYIKILLYDFSRKLFI